MKKLFTTIVAATAAAPVSAQVVPPPVPTVTVAPPAPASAGFASLDAEIAKFKAAPTPSGSWPVDKKAAKQLRRDQAADSTLCLDTANVLPWMASKKLAACDALLGGPSEAAPSSGGLLALVTTSSPDWSYRARLLQGRSLSLLALGANRLALAALDESDAIGATKPASMFGLSTGLGNTMLRAYALGRLDRKDEAMAQIGKLRAARPYASSILSAADTLQLSMDGSIDTLRQRLAVRTPLDPDVQPVLFLLEVMGGRLQEADRLGDTMNFTEPKMRGGWSISNGSSETETLERKMLFQGMRAYVAAALGKPERASGIIAAAKETLADYNGTDPRTEQRTSKRRVEEYLTRVKFTGELATKLDTFIPAAALRAENKGKDAETIMKSVEKVGAMGSLLPAAVEQMRLAGTPEANAAADSMVKLLFGSMVETKPGQLGTLLPKYETIDDVPKFASSASKWLFTDGSGWSQSKEPGGTIRTVRYETLVGSKAMMEEMVLIAAARIARQEGHDAFVVLSNRTFARFTTMTGYGYGAGTTYASGFESQARIQLVDSANPPAEFAGQPERIVTAAKVDAELGARYDDYMAQKAAIAAAKKAK